MGEVHLSEAEKVPAGVAADAPQSIPVAGTFQEESTKETPEPDEAVTSGNSLLLLIEDNADVRSYIIDILQTDYQILQAKDGEEGVKWPWES